MLPIIFFYKKNLKIKFFTIILLTTVLSANHIFGVLKLKKVDANIKNLDYKIKIISPKIDINRFLKYEDPKKKIKELIYLSNPKPLEKTIFIFPEGVLTSIYFEDLKKTFYNFLYLD